MRVVIDNLITEQGKVKLRLFNIRSVWYHLCCSFCLDVCHIFYIFSTTICVLDPPVVSLITVHCQKVSYMQFNGGGGGEVYE